ncbi:MAG TPA: hypothetical protein DEA22_06445 [Blastocatellia bacterium]|nr:hypothetical protein [Blastocatellia bacterium]
MKDQDFHKDFRNYAPISLLFAAFEKSFSLFRSGYMNQVVDNGGKITTGKVFLTLKKFSTDFPHRDVDEKAQ